MIAYSQIVQLDRTFLFISFGSFKIINSKFYNILIIRMWINTFNLIIYLESFISYNEITKVG